MPSPGGGGPIQAQAGMPRPGPPPLVHGGSVVQPRSLRAAPPAPGRPPLVHQPGLVAQRSGGNDAAIPIDPARIGLGAGGGRPLPQILLARMEAAFGTDFGAVRVHVGPQASRIGAIAFTTGNDLYFAPGQFQPESVKGQQLIGHELAHVVQQRQGRVPAPASGIAVVQDRALEAEADRLGFRAAAQPMVAPVQRRAPEAAGRSRALQRFTVIGQDKIYRADPAKRAWGGYPYAVVPKGTNFRAQQRRGGGGGTNEFLLPGHTYKALTTAHAVDRKLDAVTLRVSNDGRMAIEDSDLNDRQPKNFFATAGVIAAANGAAPVGSNVTLRQGGQSIKILTGWYSQETLYRVTADFTAPPSQNCDAIAGQITGAGAMLAFRGGAVVNDTIADLLGRNPMQYDMNANANVATYVNRQGANRARERVLGLNAGATPEVGSAFMIHTVGYPGGAGGNQVLDLASNTVRTLNWAFHFAAVVARSGTDRITLENYARGDDRRLNADPRWYFQMYGEAAGQSFHEFHEARQDYANPATVTVGANVPQQPGAWWNPFG